MYEVINVGLSVIAHHMLDVVPVYLFLLRQLYYRNEMSDIMICERILDVMINPGVYV